MNKITTAHQIFNTITMTSHVDIKNIFAKQYEFLTKSLNFMELFLLEIEIECQHSSLIFEFHKIVVLQMNPRTENS